MRSSHRKIAGWLPFSGVPTASTKPLEQLSALAARRKIAKGAIRSKYSAELQAMKRKALDEQSDALEADPRVKALRAKLPKTAGMAFLRQRRTESVKRIYRALKRDNPGMPAAMKARIAARQGKQGVQRQGPPYKGPLIPLKEKTAMPKSTTILNSLTSGSLGGVAGLGLGAVGGAGLGAAVGAGTGYHYGKKRGLAQDAMTPYGVPHVRFAYDKGRVAGRQDVIQALRKRLKSKAKASSIPKQASYVSGEALEAAEYVRENRQSVHPSLGIPASIMGY